MRRLWLCLDGLAPRRLACPRLLLMCACLPVQAADHALSPAAENTGAPAVYDTVQQVVEYPAARVAQLKW